MQIRTLASGSSGNCLLVSAGDAHLLVDAGISCRRIAAALAELSLTPGDLLGVLVTHEHSDHVSGLATLTKRWNAPIYTSPGTAGALWFVQSVIHTAPPGRDFAIGPFAVETFATSHDAAQPMGFAIACGGRKAAVVTDLGYVSDEVLDGALGCDLLVCEANHDVARLKSGPYPPALKARILSDKGHLSNDAGAALARRCVERGARTVILAHLSAENNTPARALEAAGAALADLGAEGVTLAAAPRSGLSGPYEV